MGTEFLLLGMPELPAISWDSLSAEAIFKVALPYILPFTLGACTLSLLGALITYPLSLFLISRYQKQRLDAHDPASCSEKPA
jgi:uncharacterized protein (DUF2062 family)